MPGWIAWTDTKVVVNSADLFLPPRHRDVWGWAEGIGMKMEYWARHYAPPTRSSSTKYAALRKTQSTGWLRDSIFSRVYPPSRFRINIELGARAEYTKYVHEGTAYQGRRFIYTTRGYADKEAVDSWVKNRQFRMAKDEDAGFVMPLPKGGFTQHLYLRVHGQKANPFLTDAYVKVARTHRALPKHRFARTLL